MNANVKTYKKTYSMLVDNEPGVLNRVAGLFSARGYNILSLTVGETNDSTVSRMTIVAEGTQTVLEQIAKQVAKLVPVLEVLPISDDDLFVEELVLIKVKASNDVRSYVESKRAGGESIRLVHDADDVMILRFVSNRENEDVILDELAKFTILEMCRTGEAAMSKTTIFKFND